jgi:GH24 family phage-related lysozyme (muramidase)
MLSSKALQHAIERNIGYHSHVEQWPDGTMRFGFGSLAHSETALRYGPCAAYRGMMRGIDAAQRQVRLAIDMQVTQGQFDALCALSYVSPGISLKTSDFATAINEGDYPGCAVWIARYATMAVDCQWPSARLLVWALGSFLATDTEKATCRNSAPPS